VVSGFGGGPSPIGQWLAFSDGIGAASSAMAECATTRLPAVWSDPGGDSIDVFVKRYPAAVQPAKGQLWILQGGPGLPASKLEWAAFLVGSTVPTLDIYLPDHRGTGKSTLAECPDSASPSECAASIPHLDGLTTSDAARDIGALIDATRAGSQQVFVIGNSYGTYWAQRYLQIRPDQPTGVILDSTVPIGLDFTDQDGNYNDKAHTLLSLCKTDATCSAKLGPDPVAKAEQAVAQADPGKCALPGVRFLLGQLVAGSYFERLLVPASIYRALRCADADRAWLEKVSAYRQWFNGLEPVGSSDPVLKNIGLSELWHTDATAADLFAREGTMLAVNGLPTGLAVAAPSWPRYPLDGYYGNWPSSPAPILVLQGGLDATTPYGDIVKAHYSGKGQYFVEVPSAVHAVAWPLSSPMADLTAPGCGWQVVQSFLADPTRPPDTSCIAGMAPIDFGNPPTEFLRLIGIQDLWENP
jgi:pimeloyl-ACP methyl ester carboxylesterase